MDFIQLDFLHLSERRGYSRFKCTISNYFPLTWRKTEFSCMIYSYLEGQDSQPSEKVGEGASHIYMYIRNIIYFHRTR